MFFGEYVDAINTVSERTVYKTKQLSVLSCKNQAVSNLQRTIKNAEYYIGELNRQLKVVDEHITYRTDKQARLETPVNNLYRNVSGMSSVIRSLIKTIISLLQNVKVAHMEKINVSLK